MNAQGFTDQGALTPDNLIAGEYPRASQMATITGGSFAKGTILGKITSNGKFKACTSAASDGSKDPCAILAEDVDASSDDKEAVIFLTGEFNAAALSTGAGLTVNGLIGALRDKSIFIKNNQPY